MNTTAITLLRTRRKDWKRRRRTGSQAKMGREGKGSDEHTDRLLFLTRMVFVLHSHKRQQGPE
jgi:hypothetical protein